MQNKNIVLGIDPGLVRTGWGIVRCNDLRDVKYVASGVIIVNTKLSLEARILHLQEKVSQLIEMYDPGEVVMEEVFVNMNPKTSEKLIMARTAIFARVASYGFKIYGYKPNKVKKSITGNGIAPKTTVQVMVNAILKQKIVANTLDTIDALAVAICHCYNR